MSTTHLHPVSTLSSAAPTAAPTAGRQDDYSVIPDFEGQPVDLTRAKLAGASRLELADDEWHRIDDTVRLYVEGRVTRVDHVVDPISGKLARVHTITVMDAVPLPWDSDMEMPGAHTR